jgi:mycothiol synthase
LWAHGDLPAAAALAAAAGYSRVRALWQMRRSLRDPVDEPVYAAGTTVRTFRTGRDEQAWVALNAAAFAGHPEQGGWTIEDLQLREREPWFDPSGFFLAERDGLLAGFHWTKIHDDPDGGGTAGGRRPAGADARPTSEAHPGGHGGAGPKPPVGEVYVVGVHPREQGTGLGRALTLTGLRYLRDRGLDQVMLYADESNRPAIALYTSLGFAHSGTDVMFARKRGDSRKGGGRKTGDGD